MRRRSFTQTLSRAFRLFLAMLAVVLSLGTVACARAGLTPTSTADQSFQATPGQPTVEVSTTPTGDPSQEFAGTILIGSSTSLTGSLAAEANLTLNGSRLAIDEYNKAGGISVGGKRYKLELKSYDDAGNADATVKLIDRLINEDRAQFLLSPYGSNQVQAGAPISEKNKVLMINTGGAADSIFASGFKYLFSTMVPASKYLVSTIDLALAQTDPPVKKIALIGVDDLFSVTALEATEKYSKSKGLEVVYSAKYSQATQDTSPLLTAIREQQPDALFGSGHLEDAVLTVQQAREVGIEVNLLGFTIGPATPDFVKSLGEEANYILGPTAWSPQQQISGDDVFKTSESFARLYQERFNEAPTYQSAFGAVGVVALAKAIEAANSIDTEKVREALINLDADTFWGKVKFNEQQVTADHPMLVEQIQNGEHVLVWPADVAIGRLLYPIPSWNQPDPDLPRTGGNERHR
ncbi:MAG: amino acid ABC transporter substrate-binding protein [Chloroflexi bacterium]|nr:amino acid ABC transporter substrate-binding protein [Chloroflexota bacterium]